MRTKIQSDNTRVPPVTDEVAAGFADHGRGFAGDGAFVDGRHAGDHLAIAGDGFAGLDQHHVAAAQQRRLADGLAAPCVGRGVAGVGVRIP